MARDEQETRKMLTELLDLDSGLTAWEVEFLDGLVGRRSFTDKQMEKVEQIWNDRIGNKK